MLIDESHVSHDNWWTNDSMMKFLSINDKWNSTSTFGNNYTVELSTEDVYKNAFGDAYPVNVIMKNTKTIVRDLTLSTEGGKAALYKDGKKVIDNGGTWPLAGGTVLELRMKPDSGKTVDKIEIIGAHDSSKPIATLFNSSATMTNSKTKETRIYDVTDTLPQLDDGSYQFFITSPYQNSTFKVTFKDDTSVPTGEVILKTAANGDLQFEEHNSVSNRQFSVGDTVTVYARPYKGYVSKEIKLTDQIARTN